VKCILDLGVIHSVPFNNKPLLLLVFSADVFEDTAPFASSVLDGYNVCIFAYGQTGTGKTFTMEGTEEDRGVNFRTLEQVFHMIKEREKLFRYDVSVSVLEVYNEQIKDLLVSDSQPGVAAKRYEFLVFSLHFHLMFSTIFILSEWFFSRSPLYSDNESYTVENIKIVLRVKSTSNHFNFLVAVYLQNLLWT